MPLYAYGCRGCGKEFTTLVRSGETPECPACAGTDLERRLSLTAEPAKTGGEAMPAPCGMPGGCGGGGCGCPAFDG